MEKTKVTVWITSSQGGALALISKRQRLEENAYVAELKKEGKSSLAARMEAARMRPEWWPPLEVLVARAVEDRLAEPDLAGPWRPLTPTEESRMSLAGRWPGPADRIPLVQRNYSLPVDLVRQLRTASWRVSEPSLRELERRGLVGSGLVLSPEEVAERQRLAAGLYPPGRIVREALDRRN